MLDGDAIGRILERKLTHVRKGPLDESSYSSPLHSERVASILGIALGVSFITCFITGEFSHVLQHPPSWLSWRPTGPANLYRFTQGLHVAAGTASIPLLLAKLWTVYPRLFTTPPIRNLAHLAERAFVPFLVAGAIFQLFTGLANTARWYPWQFDFVSAHHWTAWIVIGALVTHIGAKLPVTRRALGRVAVAREPVRSDGGLGRRGFLAAAFGAAGVLTLTTIGQTLRPLAPFDLLAPRDPTSDLNPQGVPVNKSAAGAGVLKKAVDPAYALTVDGKGIAKPLAFTLAQLRALPQHEAHLPIACVEGWSAGATWRGVPMAELLRRAGAPDHASARVHSLQTGGAYSTSELSSDQAHHPDTLLALELNGAPLHIDHGYPVRLIGPARPGVQQTKWLARVEVT